MRGIFAFLPFLLLIVMLMRTREILVVTVVKVSAADRDAQMAQFVQPPPATSGKPRTEPMPELSEFSEIPKIIHLIWFSPGLPEDQPPTPKETLANVQSFRDNNPGYEIRLWNNRMLRQEFPHIAKICAGISRPAAASDMARYAILEKYGGFYFDADMLSVGSMEDFRTKYHPAFVTMMMGRNWKTVKYPKAFTPEFASQRRGGNNNVLGSVPHYPFFKMLNEYVLDRVEKKLEKDPDPKNINKLSGPYVLQQVVLQWVNDKTIKLPLNVVPENHFAPCGYRSCSKEEFEEKKVQPHYYAFHEYSNSWKGDEPKNEPAQASAPKIAELPAAVPKTQSTSLSEYYGEIPKIIHLIWFSPGLPEEQPPIPAETLANVQSFRDHNPGYEIRLWNNKMLREEFPDIARICAGISRPAAASDMTRYAIMYKYGGFYFDADMTSTGPMEDFRTEFHPAFITMMMGKNWMNKERPKVYTDEVVKQRTGGNNNVLGSVPGYPFFKMLNEFVWDRVEKKLEKDPDPTNINKLSGPYVLQQVLKKWVYNETITLPLNMVPENHFAPCGYRSCSQEEFEGKKDLPYYYAFHEYSNSWKGDEPNTNADPAEVVATEEAPTSLSVSDYGEIPKIIHLIWLSPHLPEDQPPPPAEKLANVQSFRDQNPG